MSTMNKREMRTLLRGFLNEGDLNKGRRDNFVTTEAGAADGSTAISSNITAVDDALIGAYVRYNGEERQVSDFANTNGVFTVKPAFSEQVTDATTLELFERGRYSDLDLENALNQAQAKVSQVLPDQALYFLERHVTSITNTLASSTRIINRGNVLSDMMRLRMVTLVDAKETVYRIVGMEDIQNIQDPKHPDYATSQRPAALIAGGLDGTSFGDIWLYPTANASVDVFYIKSPSDLTLSQVTETTVSDVPEQFMHMVLLYAAYISTGKQDFFQQFMGDINTLRASMGAEPLGFAGEQEPKK